MDSNIKQLVVSLNKTLTEGVNELGEKYQAVQLLPELKKKYSDQLRPEIVSVRFYQTEKACYLETTIDEYKEKGIDPEDTNTEVPYEEYSRVNFRIHRESLAFISSVEEPAFKPDLPVLENAAGFLADMDPYSLINCTDLFTEEAEKEIAEEHETERENTHPAEPVEYISGEISFSRDSLKAMVGYNSEEDPDFPGTPLARLLVTENEVNILLNQNDKHVGANNPELPENLPAFVTVESDEFADQERFTTIKILNSRVENINVKTTEAPYIEYNLPREYEYLIELTSGEKLIVEGVFGEDSEDGGFLPGYWYYQHKVLTKKG